MPRSNVITFDRMCAKWMVELIGLSLRALLFCRAARWHPVQPPYTQAASRCRPPAAPTTYFGWLPRTQSEKRSNFAEMRHFSMFFKPALSHLKCNTLSPD